MKMPYADRLREMLRFTRSADPSWSDERLVELAEILWPGGDQEHEHDSDTLGRLTSAFTDSLGPSGLARHEAERVAFAWGDVEE